MHKLIERSMHKIKYFVKKLFWIIGIFTVLTIVLRDLDKPGGGYLQWIFTWIFLVLMSGFNDAVEIAQTPLASLTMAKIFIFVWYVSIACLILILANKLWSSISDKLDDLQNKKFEEERKREKEEARYLVEAQEECSQCVFDMGKTKNMNDLNSLFYHAIGKWPKWEKQLSRIYKARKRWLEKNSSV
jgi:hypothetical protein